MNKYNTKYKQICGVLLSFYIISIIFLNVITPAKVFSESENRNLEQKPKFSVEKLFQGKFTKSYEKYITDQFIFRDFWIGIKSDADRALGKNKGNDVYLGKDEYLLQAFTAPNAKVFNGKIAEINAIAAAMPQGKKYFMLAPNSVNIYRDKLPYDAITDDEKVNIDKVASAVDKSIDFVNVYDKLYSKKDEYIYYKTDHHWTSKGAFYAFTVLAQSMGFESKGEDYFTKKVVTDTFLGSLYSKSGFRHINPDSIEIYTPLKDENIKVNFVDEEKNWNSLYDMGELSKKDKYAVFLGGNHGLIKITTNAEKGKKLLLIKDSYANSLIPFLTSEYSEIYVVDLRYYDEELKDLVKDNNIKEMLILYNVNTFLGNGA